MELLADHPLLGRDAEEGCRELILARGKFGYVAKYRWLPPEDTLINLAVRHQLEAGCKDESGGESRQTVALAGVGWPGRVLR